MVDAGAVLELLPLLMANPAATTPAIRNPVLMVYSVAASAAASARDRRSP